MLIKMREGPHDYTPSGDRAHAVPLSENGYGSWARAARTQVLLTVIAKNRTRLPGALES